MAAAKSRQVLHDLRELDSVKERFKNKEKPDKVTKQFVIPEEPDKKIEDIIKEIVPEQEDTTEYVADNETFKEETQRIVERDANTILILNKAIKHVREYDSKDTALVLLNRAYRFCPSIFNRRLISGASASLKAAIKAEKWQKSRRRKRHVDESTVQRNLTTFYERVADAVLSISNEIDKRNNKMFSRIKTEYVSELPLVIPESKSYIIRNAHVVAHCAHKPDGKFTHLERQLYLIEDATVIGINLNRLEKGESAVDKASVISLKHNAPLYEQVLLRPAQNVQWYLMLNFGTKVTFASFADTLQIDDNDPVGGTSYEDYLRQQEQQARIEEKLKTQRLRDFRLQFEEDNRPLKEDLSVLQMSLDNLEDKKSKISEQFAALTKVSETDNGLSISHASKLEARMRLYRSNLMALDGFTSLDATEQSTRQRIEARSYLYEYKDIQMSIRMIQHDMSIMRQEWDHRRHQAAYRLGLINPNSMRNNEFYTPKK